MSQKHFELLEALQCADDVFVDAAGKDWEQKKRPYFRRAGIRAACMLLIAAAGLGGVFHKQVAEAISSFTTRLAEWMGNDNDLRQYTEVVDETQTKDGVSMTLKEVLIDASNIRAAVEVSWEDGIVTGHPWLYYGAIYINGEYVDTLMLKNYETEEEGQYVLLAPYEEGAIPQEINDVTLMIRFVQSQEDGTVDGLADFTFAFETTKESIMEQTATLSINRTLKTEDLIFHVQDMTYTDASARIRVQMEGDPRTFCGEGDDQYTEINYFLCLTDEQENWLEFDAVDYDEETGMLVLDMDCGTPAVDTASYFDIELCRCYPIEVSEVGEEPSAEALQEQYPGGLPGYLDKVRLELK